MKEIARGFIVLLFLLVITGLIYPLAMTGVGQLLFPKRVNGSLVNQDSTIVGSKLIGQNFVDPRYFFGRPSATNPPYNPASSNASNLGAMNPVLIERVKARIAMLQAADPSQKEPIPVGLVTSSGSGLDPDISIAAAEYQAPRIAKLRGLTLDQVNALIQQNTTLPQFGFLGLTRVNVLALNLALDQAKP